MGTFGSPFIKSVGKTLSPRFGSGLALPRANLLAYYRGEVDTIGLSVSQLQPLVDGAGTTYYVDPVNGDDAAACSSVAPWKNLYYAGQMAGNTDNIVLVGSTPARWNVSELPAISLQAGAKLSAQSIGYIIKSIDMSNGSVIPVGHYNFDFESWVDETTPSGWRKVDDSGSYIRVAGDSGTYAIRFLRYLGYISCGSYLWLNASTEYTVTVRVNSTTVANNVVFTIRNSSSGIRYLQNDGTTWSGTGNSVVITTDAGDVNTWVTKTFTFTSDIYKGPYFLIISGNGSKNGTYISYDYITIEPTTPQVFTWVFESGSTYSLPINCFSSVTALAKCTDSEWAASGIDALARVPKDTSTPTAPAAGKWGFDSGSIYYTLATGEDIEDIHFEATPANGEAVVEIASANSVAVENIITVGGVYGFYMTGTSAGTVLQNCQAICPEASPFHMESTSDTTIRKCRGIGSTTADGATIVGEASAKVLSSWFEDNYDDGINGNTTGTCTFSLNVCKDNKYKDPTSSGIETQGSGTYYLYNNVLTGNQKGWHNMATGTYTVKGNIAYNNLDRNFNPAATGTLVADKNCSFGANDGVDFIDENLITTDPIFADADNGDFSLQAGSPCIGAGVDVFTNGYGDQYDAAGNIVWNDTYDLPDGHWIDGVDIGAYAYGGANPVFPKLSNPSEGVWIWESAPAILAITGVDNAVYNADGTGKDFATAALAIAAFDSLADDTNIFSGRKGIAVYSVDSSAIADRINRALGN